MNLPAARVRAIAMDVDGVLTDGGIYLGADGPPLKRIAFRDVMGVSLGRKAGLVFALVSGEGGPVLGRISAQLGIEDVYPDCKDKASALRDFAARRQVPLSDICFVGDDVNDLPAMALAGFSACPSDAHPEVQAAADWVLPERGGYGAVRGVLDRILGNRNS